MNLHYVFSEPWFSSVEGKVRVGAGLKQVRADRIFLNTEVYASVPEGNSP